MDEKPKGIIALERLWLSLSGIFFLLSIDSVIVLIFLHISFSDTEPNPDIGLPCFSVLLFIFLFCITFSLFALKIWRSIKKGNKSAIKSGFVFSTLSLLIFSGPFVLLLWVGFGASFPPFFSWQFLLYTLVFLVLLFDIIIMVISSKSEVKSFVKAPESDK